MTDTQKMCAVHRCKYCDLVIPDRKREIESILDKIVVRETKTGQLLINFSRENFNKLIGITKEKK